MTALPKYKINDQVIVLSKNEVLTYELGIIRHAQKNGGNWEYFILIHGKIISLPFPESQIMGAVFESKDLLTNPSLQEAENAIKL